MIIFYITPILISLIILMAYFVVYFYSMIIIYVILIIVVTLTTTITYLIVVIASYIDGLMSFFPIIVGDVYIKMFWNNLYDHKISFFVFFFF
jgi:hypothetical protein